MIIKFTASRPEIAGQEDSSRLLPKNIAEIFVVLNDGARFSLCTKDLSLDPNEIIATWIYLSTFAQRYAREQPKLM